MVTDVPDSAGTSESATPAGEDDDFFSSWDKPAIKRPSNPPSRTGTPRAQSPFLKPGVATGNGADRPKSPLVSGENTTPAAVKPTVRKTTAGAAPKKNILGAKKKGLGAKKVVPADGGLDFDEAERKAREEAERIEKLGYDPDAEAAESAAAAKPKAAEASNIAAPTPVSPPRGGFGSTVKPDRWDAETEGLGAGVARLGFGQVGAAKKAAPAKKMGGFGSVGKPVDDSQKFAREIFFLGRTYSAEDMQRMGAVNIVADHADLEREALQVATEIMGKSPQAQRMLKFAFNLTDDGLMGQQVFAGEATHESLWGTVNGAWESGERAADAVLKLIGRR